MANATGEAKSGPLLLQFNRSVRLLYSKGKGSNERRSKPYACITDNAPHNATNQMSRTLS